MRRYVLILASLLVACSCSAPAELIISTKTTSYHGLIFIGGNINNPGLYPYSADDRLSDLINAAGGLKEGADASDVELVFAVREFSQKIDVNRAEAWLLEALPGVGESTAQAIVIYRENNGVYHSIDELLKVPGIGPATVSKIAPYVVVGGG